MFSLILPFAPESISKSTVTPVTQTLTSHSDVRLAITPTSFSGNSENSGSASFNSIALHIIYESTSDSTQTLASQTFTSRIALQISPVMPSYASQSSDSIAGIQFIL